MARNRCGILRIEGALGTKFRARWISHDGKRGSATFATEGAAKKFLRDKETEADDVRSGRVQPPAPPKPPSPLVKDFARDWMTTYCTSAGNRETTVEAKQHHLDHHIVPGLGELRLDQIRGEAVDKFFAGLKKKRGSGPIAEKTRKNIRTTLFTMLKTAVRWGHLDAVPELPNIRPPDPKWDHLAEDEVHRLLDATRSPEERLLILFAIHTGLRAGEQRVIEWGDVDRSGRFVVVRRSHARNGAKAGPTKSGKERRVPLSATLLEALKAFRELKHLDGGLVFKRHDREKPTPLSVDQMHERLWSSCRRAGLRKMRWHDLRHTFASLLVSNSVDLIRVKTWLGHGTLEMTQRYSHLAPNAGDAIAVLDRDLCADVGAVRGNRGF